VFDQSVGAPQLSPKFFQFSSRCWVHTESAERGGCGFQAGETLLDFRRFAREQSLSQRGDSVLSVTDV